MSKLPTLSTILANEEASDLSKLLFTGIGSAIISGVVAFSVAWITFRRDYKMRERDRVRQDIIAFCETISEVIKFLKFNKYDDAMMRAHDATTAALRLWSLYREKYPAPMEWANREATILEVMIFQAKKSSKKDRLQHLQQCVARAGSVHGYMTRWARDVRRRPPGALDMPSLMEGLDPKELQKMALENPEAIYGFAQEYARRTTSQHENESTSEANESQK